MQVKKYVLQHILHFFRCGTLLHTNGGRASGARDPRARPTAPPAQHYEDLRAVRGSVKPRPNALPADGQRKFSAVLQYRTPLPSGRRWPLFRQIPNKGASPPGRQAGRPMGNTEGPTAKRLAKRLASRFRAGARLGNKGCKSMGASAGEWGRQRQAVGQARRESAVCAHGGRWTLWPYAVSRHFAPHTKAGRRSRTPR